MDKQIRLGIGWSKNAMAHGFGAIVRVSVMSGDTAVTLRKLCSTFSADVESSAYSREESASSRVDVL